MIVVLAIGMLSGFLAGGVDPPRPGGRPGSLESALASFEHIAGWLLGMVAGLRCIATLHDDGRSGWLTQLFASGVRRDAYLAYVAAATIIAAGTDYLLATLSFLAVHAAAAGMAPLGRVLGALPTAPLWMSAATALAVVCAVVLGDRTRARFGLVTLLLLPYAAMFLYAFLNDDQPPPGAMLMLARWLIPHWPPALTTPAAGQLLLYTSVALSAALLLAHRRIGRSR